MNKKILIIGLILVVVCFLTVAVASAYKSQGKLTITDSITHQNKTVNYEAHGLCYKVVDGYTIWVKGVGKVRFVQVNTPEKKQTGYQEAKDFIKQKCLNKEVYLDIDDAKPKDKYNRTLAMVYVDYMDLNKELLNQKLAKIMYMPPSEFKKGQISSFNFLFF